MKKCLSMLTAVALLVSSLGTYAYAENGPMESSACVEFLELPNYEKVQYAYKYGTVVNECDGANYDEDTNTLTLTNFSGDNMIMQTSAMGDDFTLKVVGDCRIEGIYVKGWGYGGTLNITGDGTLTVNAQKQYTNAIVLDAEKSNASLNFGPEVNVNLYAPQEQDAVSINKTAVSEVEKAVTFGSEQSVTVNKSDILDSVHKQIRCYDMTETGGPVELYKVVNSEEPNGTYGAEKKITLDGVDGYYINKLDFNETEKAYLGIEKEFIPEDDLDDKGYSLQAEAAWENCYVSWSFQYLYKDASKQECIRWSSGVGQRVIAQVEPIADTDYYKYDNVKSVDKDIYNALDEVMVDTTVEGIYNYTFGGTEFIYKAGATASDEPAQPSTDEPAQPSTDEPAQPSTDEPTQPSAGGTGTTPAASDTGTSAPSAGTQLTDSKSKGMYEVIKAEGTTGTVVYTGTKDKKKKTVTIPATVTVDGITYAVTAVDDNALKGNKTVTKVTIPKNVTTIGKNAFSGCTKLKTVTIGSNVKTVGANAFKDCKALTKVTLPSKTTTIGANAFNGCKKLNTITIKSKKMTSKTIAKNAFKGVSSKATIKVPKGKAKTYKTLFQKKGLSKKAKVK